MKNLIKKLTACLLVGILAAGCSANTKKEDNKNGGSNTQGVTLAYSKEAQEKYGLPETFELEKTPERLVVMTLGPTEILHNLGVEMIAVPDILDESSDWAKELKAERLPFTAKTLDTESVLALEPDMIIMSASKKEAYGNFFEEKGIAVYYTVTNTMDSGAIDEVKAQVELYGNGFHRDAEVKTLMSRFDQLEADIEQWKKDNADLQGQKMMILLETPFTYTNTSKTSLGNMMESLGFVNMADTIEGLESVMDTQTLQISTEVIVEQNPPMIITQPSGAGAGISITTETYKNNHEKEFTDNSAVWSKIDAVKNNKILYLGTDVFPGTTGLGIFTCYEYLMEALPKL